MTLDIDPQWVSTSAFLWLRLGSMLLLSPIMSLIQAPRSFKVVLTLAWAGVLAAGLPGSVDQVEPVAGEWVLACLSEALLGAVLGFGIHVAFAALQMAARLIDLQMGIAIGGVYDPATHLSSSALWMALQLTGVAAFFALDAHQALLRGLVFSMEKVPVGTVFMSYSPEAVLAAFGAVFTMAMVIGAPVVLAMFLLDIGLAVVSRALPQMNVFFVSIPLKILAGLILLILLSRQLTPLLGKTFAGIFVYWERVL